MAAEENYFVLDSSALEHYLNARFGPVESVYLYGAMRMASRRPKTRGRGKAVKKKTLPLSRTNYLLFLIGLVVIVLGYVALSRPPASNFWSLTVAPILLVVGYCVIIPIAIIIKGKSRDKEKEES